MAPKTNANTVYASLQQVFWWVCINPSITPPKLNACEMGFVYICPVNVVDSCTIFHVKLVQDKEGQASIGLAYILHQYHVVGNLERKILVTAISIVI